MSSFISITTAGASVRLPPVGDRHIAYMIIGYAGFVKAAAIQFPVQFVSDI